MPANPESYFDFVKIRKSSIHNLLLNRKFNHPHRLNQISMTGSFSLIIDGRGFTAFPPVVGSTTTLTEYDLDLAPVPSFTRYFENKCPISHYLSAELSSPRKIALLHQPRYPWRFIQNDRYEYEPTVVGTYKTTSFIYDGTNWNQTSTTTSDHAFDFYVSIDGGGYLYSGGKVADSDAVKARILLTHNLPEIDTPLEILRLPWQNTWASETAIFSNAFNAFIADGNAANGGGYSGSCSVSLNFVNQ